MTSQTGLGSTLLGGWCEVALSASRWGGCLAARTVIRCSSTSSLVHQALWRVSRGSVTGLTNSPGWPLLVRRLHPARRRPPQAHHRHARQVHSCCQQRKVCFNPNCPPHSCPTPTVPAPHQMSDLTLDFGAGGSVVGDPVGMRLPGTSTREHRLMRTNTDRAT